MVESGSESSADELKQKSQKSQKSQKRTQPGQPQIDDQLKQQIHQELEQRIQKQEEQKQKTQVGNGGPNSSQDFAHFEKARIMPRPKQPARSRREEADKHSYDGDDDDSGGCGDCLASLIQWPVFIAAAIIVPVFGITFVIIGGININHCKIEPLLPIWLIVQGVVMLLGIGTGGMAKRSSHNGKVSFPMKVLGGIVSLATIAWFLAGNVWVYQAWAQSPDYAHDWFENGCNKSLFNVAFIGIIVLDALFAISVIVGCVAFVLRGCKSK
ncbi:transmembrane protein 272-like isoform X1 [Cherax quadricarinatus]